MKRAIYSSLLLYFNHLAWSDPDYAAMVIGVCRIKVSVKQEK
jgi:hypothetical protein